MNPSDAAAAPLPRLAPRKPDSHKGDYGRALLIGGSSGMAGAVALAGMAALRSGAGLVKLATPHPCLPTVASFEPSLMTAALPGDDEDRIAQAALPVLKELSQEATALACGPGLGRSDELVKVVAALYQQVPQPTVFDADALFALAQRREVLQQ